MVHLRSRAVSEDSDDIPLGRRFAKERAAQVSRADTPLESDSQPTAMVVEATAGTGDHTSADAVVDDAGRAVADEPKGPTLLETALKAIVQKGKSSLNKGDVLLILDKNDLSKTVRVDTTLLLSHSPVMRTSIYTKALRENLRLTESGIRCIFALDDFETPQGMRADMPVLMYQEIDKPAPVNVAVPAEIVEVVEDAVRVKTEDVDAEITLGAQQQDYKPVIAATCDWPRAYEVLLRMMKNASNISTQTCRLPAKAELCLSYLEQLIIIAEYYECLQVVISAFKSLASDWISGRNLYPAIAEQPRRWLLISLKLKSDLVYKEAFVHLAGQYPNIDLAGIPAAVDGAIALQSRELQIKRLEVGHLLLTSSIHKSKIRSKGPLGAVRVAALVSQNHYPETYSAVNVWRDWVGEHLAVLHHTVAIADIGDAPETELCNHKSITPGQPAECLTVAGFYRALSAGGDAYLPAEKVIEYWNEDIQSGFAKGEDEDLRASLQVLKAQAKVLVAPMIKSSLQYEERHQLPYLTCVEVGKVPWAVEEEGEEDEMEVD